MSVIAKSEEGFLLDHKEASVLSIYDEKSADCSRHWMLKQELFEINHPFRMDSQFEKVQSQEEKTEEPVKVKRKRKRVAPLNAGEVLAEEYHQEVKGYVNKAYVELIEIGKQNHYFIDQNFHELTDNNMAARQAALLNVVEPDFITLCERQPGGVEKIRVEKDIEISSQRIVNNIIENDSQQSVVLKYINHQYIVPHCSSFLMTDIHNLKIFSKDLGRYDLIVMDPPWENKSVKRKKMYYTLDNEMLLDMPLDELMLPGCVLVVWVTNKQKHIKFVQDELFRKFGIEYIGRWYWLKVTKSGECVFDLNYQHKKPYETLIIGKLRKPCCHGNRVNEHINKVDVTNDDILCACHSIQVPDNQVLISVPCSLHSKKPPLTDVLTQYLPENARYLELFARNLQPNWTSWGNEVLLHQNHGYYEEVT
ncbi:Methyltransferase-like protein 4 [Mactra antiquata]